MFGRLMLIVVGLGCGALGFVMILQRYAAPSCRSEVATSQVVTEVSAKTGLSGLYLLNAHSIGGGLLARSRTCSVDVAEIRALQPLIAAHWLQVIYSATIDRPTGVVSVRSRVAGPVDPVFTVSPAA
jgi:hypothetical protein